MKTWYPILALGLFVPACGFGQETVIRVKADHVLHKISPYLTGACIEDVNHEIYGGLYSQMIFGESFQEPPARAPVEGFSTYGGLWTARGESVEVGPGDGPKLVADGPSIESGEVSVEVRFLKGGGGNAGLVLKVRQPEVGADAFSGYEVSLEPSGRLVLGRHRQNFEPIRSVKCPVEIGQWVPLAVRMDGPSLKISVHGKPVLEYEDTEHPLAPGQVGLRAWRHSAVFRNLKIKTKGQERVLAFHTQTPQTLADGVSGMWRPFTRGSAQGSASLDTSHPFVGRQSQKLSFTKGEGAVGIENRGLNRWGLAFEAGKPYECEIWFRADSQVSFSVALENADGSKVLARAPTPRISTGDWSRCQCTLTPNESVRDGRFSISLTGPGSVELGYVFLQPGEWGRFHGLPVRKDVAEALLDEGVSILRYGGSEINHPQYLWKKMTGPRARRRPMPGTWYPYVSNGWGIFDFLSLCEALGIPGVPALNLDERPEDMADFVEYVNGPSDSEWGRQRAEDGHPEPYRLKYVELGNEEAVNDAYFARFQPIAEAMWAKDPDLILIVGDFAYHQVIDDPYHFEGGVAVNSLAAHEKILKLAKEHGREVWFDIHVSTDHPPQPDGLKPERSYIRQLRKLADGARFKVVVFEYNSGNHAQRRALSNALATNEVERIGDALPVACSANGLQPDGQNDNGWDQGLLFLDPSKVWLQPPGYVLQMTRRSYQPLLVKSEVSGPRDKLSVNAKTSDDGKTLVLQVVNWDSSPRSARIEADGFSPSRPLARAEALAGPPEAVNTANNPNRIVPRRSQWWHHWSDGGTRYTFEPYSFTVLTLE